METNKIFELITPFIDQLQEEEYVLSDLKYKRSISSSEGVQLDKLGTSLNVLRLGDTDEDYRARILFKVYINTSTGTVEQVISFVKNVTGAINVKYEEQQPATIKITTDTMGGVNMQELYDNVSQVIGSGVQLKILYVNPALDAFAFADENGITTDGRGFADENGVGTGGGAMSEQF